MEVPIVVHYSFNVYMGAHKHQNIQIDIFKCLIQIFSDDPSIAQGFCEA